MEPTDRLMAADAVADDKNPDPTPEVKKEPMEADEKPDYMRNMIFAPKEPHKLRRSSVNNEVRPCMVHLYSHRRLRKELEDRGLNPVGSRADCTDRLLCFLSGKPQPDSYPAVKKHVKRKIMVESPATVAIAKVPSDEEIQPTLDKKKAKKRRFWLPKAENTEESLEELVFDKKTTPPTILKAHRNFVGEFDEVDDLEAQAAVPPELLTNFVYAKHLPDVIFILVPPTFRCEDQPRVTTAHNTLYSFIKAIGADESVILAMESSDQNDETTFGVVNCFTDIVKREITKQRDRNDREMGGKRIVLVGWGLSCYLNHRALKSVAGVSALIDLAFHMKTQHGIGGGPDDDHVIYTYCPTLFVVGNEAESYNQDVLQKMRASMLCETAVITIPHANENLLVPAAELFRHGVCQIAVFKNIASDIIDFLRSQADEESITDSGLPSLPTPLAILNSSARVLAARAHFNEALKKARFPETVTPKLQPTIMPRSCPIAQRKDYLESIDGRTPYPTFDIRPPYRVVIKTTRGASNRRHVNTNLPQARSVSYTAPTPPPVPPHRYLVWPPVQRPRPVSASISMSEVPQPQYKDSNDPADISIM